MKKRQKNVEHTNNRKNYRRLMELPTSICIQYQKSVITDICSVAHNLLMKIADFGEDTCGLHETSARYFVQNRWAFVNL
jgi:hypothetical protein